MLKDETKKVLENSFKTYIKRYAKKHSEFDLELVTTEYESTQFLNFVRFIIQVKYYQYLENDLTTKLIDKVFDFRNLGENIIKMSEENEKAIYVTFTMNGNYDNIGKEKLIENHIRSKKKLNLKINVDAVLKKNELNIILDFIHYLNDNLTLHADVLIDLIDKKTEKMTTGVRMPHHHIKILCKHRMLVDVLRTLAHEWVHEYQHQEMGSTDKGKRLEVGGWGENHANAMSGILLKKYVKQHKELEQILY